MKKIKQEELIKIIKLTKNFGKKKIFENLNLNIYKGETIAILGPNGSGKSTLLNIITGLLKPTSGSVEYPGYKNMKEFYKTLGIQFQESEFPKGYTTDQMVDLIFQFSNKKPKDESYKKWIKQYEKNIKTKLYKAFKLIGKEKRLAIKLSGGEKQRLNIMLAFLSNPTLLIIDEITTGLDLTAQSSILSYVNKYKQIGNKTIIFVSHNINEINVMADRIIILDKHKIIENLTRQKLIKEYKSVPNFLNEYFIGKGVLK